MTLRCLTLVVIRCHSLPFVTTRCLSLYHSLSLDVIRCTTHCHSLSLVLIRCQSLYHSLSLDISLVCLFINDLIVASCLPSFFQKKYMFQFSGGFFLSLICFFLLLLLLLLSLPLSFNKFFLSQYLLSLFLLLNKRLRH